MNTIQEILDNCIVSEETDCWLWQGAVTGSGDGNVRYNGRMLGTHRVTYILLIGDVTSKQVLYHLCDNKICCNPYHLELISQSEMRKRSRPPFSNTVKNILERLTIDCETGCWIWPQSLTDGYGNTTFQGKRISLHRFIYEIFASKIPAGLVIDHLCRNRACCNPEHLEPVTIGENTLRGETISAANKAKTHCPRSHEYNEENSRTYLIKGTNRYGRRCKICDRISHQLETTRKTCQRIQRECLLLMS